MKLEYLVFRLAALAFVVAITFYSVGLSKSLYGWTVWRLTDGSAIAVDGVVERIHQLKGRDRGSQYLWLKDSRGRSERFNSVLAPSELKRISKTEETVRVRYYPTATGKKYVFSVYGLGTNKPFYEGEFHNEYWQGVVVLLMVLMAAGMGLTMLAFALGIIVPDNYRQKKTGHARIEVANNAVRGAINE